MPAFAANLVTNGTFDSSCAGWALTNTDGFTCSSTEGNPGFALVLNNAPNLVPTASQTIAGLVSGGVYTITLDAKTHYNCCNSATTPGAGVGIAGQQFDFLVVNNQPWVSYGPFTFTYNGTGNVLVLSSQRNGTDSDAEFDNVVLDVVQLPTGVPEPGSLLLFVAGASALLVRKRLV